MEFSYIVDNEKLVVSQVIEKHDNGTATVRTVCVIPKEIFVKMYNDWIANSTETKK